MAETLKPSDEAQVRDAVAEALAAGTPLEVVAGGSKRGFGRATAPSQTLDISGLTGITLYEPDELVMTARAATPLAEVTAALDEHHQMLAFEPADLGPLLGAPAAQATIGGIFACNLAGPGRIRHGAARDHLLGFHAVSGRDELFKSGGRVVKNVSGYDMCKILAGSFGTLAIMTDVSFKVLPAPEKTRTVLVMGADEALSVAAMTRALTGPGDVSAAAHLPAEIAARSGVSYVATAGMSVTALRVDGPGPSAEVRCAALREALGEFGATEELHGHNSGGLWREVAEVAPLLDSGGSGEAADGGDESAVWRVSVPPASGAAVAATIRSGCECELYFDWGGGLIWARVVQGTDAASDVVRGAIAECGGHATLIRASDGLRGTVPVFQPQDAALAALTARIKDGFDPKGILNPGRMYDGV
jgi:glycolate oxidase FAD binding subunit